MMHPSPERDDHLKTLPLRSCYSLDSIPLPPAYICFTLLDDLENAVYDLTSSLSQVHKFLIIVRPPVIEAFSSRREIFKSKSKDLTKKEIKGVWLQVTANARNI